MKVNAASPCLLAPSIDGINRAARLRDRRRGTEQVKRTEVVVDVGRIAESDPLTIEAVAKLVAERREKRAARRDPFLDGRADPDADHLLLGVVCPE
jgi:hypothetical protein